MGQSQDTLISECAGAPNERVTRYAEPLWLLAWGLLGDEAEAEKAVQEVFVVAASQLSPDKGYSSFLPWLGSILLGLVRGHRGNRPAMHRVRSCCGLADRRQGTLRDDTADQAGPTCQGEPTSADLLVMVRSLPIEHREAIVLREVLAMSYEEMSEAMGVPVKMVGLRLAAARSELLKMLRPKLVVLTNPTREPAGDCTGQASAEPVGGDAMAGNR